MQAATFARAVGVPTFTAAGQPIHLRTTHTGAAIACMLGLGVAIPLHTCAV